MAMTPMAVVAVAGPVVVPEARTIEVAPVAVSRAVVVAIAVPTPAPMDILHVGLLYDGALQSARVDVRRRLCRRSDEGQRGCAHSRSKPSPELHAVAPSSS